MPSFFMTLYLRGIFSGIAIVISDETPLYLLWLERHFIARRDNGFKNREWYQILCTHRFPFSPHIDPHETDIGQKIAYPRQDQEQGDVPPEFTEHIEEVRRFCIGI